ncbi:serine hydrolase domain-containing protein [Roseovarius rhodophyticola]|uniref:Serine hydrolase domain-containing protein n=1 Tax=Roseovarius rhodophyticola TaxID=3080827 RepID=A0ABZ2TI45_9RHOB|nr:serine hydrolase domain-containing protein [Roseovarius sp. W115]MDV2929706.1 serine hydrolase domain-containing protein [Roseovarius sp. W115]
MSQSGKRIFRFGALAVIAIAAVAFVFMRKDPTEEDVVAAFLKATGIPGAVLAYGPSDGAPMLKAFGVSDPIKATPMQVDQVLPLASLTKPITAAALVSLAEAGEIALDVPLADQIPLPAPHDPRAASVTPRNLLAHRGGFDRTATFDPVFEPEKMGLTREESCHDLAKAAWAVLPLDHTPDSTKAYSNIGICLLTDLLTQNGARDLEQILQTQARITLGGMAGPNWVQTDTGWQEVQGSEAERAWIAGLGAAGSAMGRAEDMWTFAAQTPAASAAPIPEGEDGDFYALGWRIWPGPDGRQLTHWGGLQGVFTAMFRFSDGHVVVVLFNSSPGNYSAGFNVLYAGLCQARGLDCRPAQ